jgi:hypothetical protein
MVIFGKSSGRFYDFNAGLCRKFQKDRRQEQEAGAGGRGLFSIFHFSFSI